MEQVLEELFCEGVAALPFFRPSMPLPIADAVAPVV
jgi:hypothetical protein